MRACVLRPYACAPCVCVECVSSDERCCNVVIDGVCVYLYNSREDFNIFGKR